MFKGSSRRFQCDNGVCLRSTSVMPTITEAAKVWKLLNGIVCVFKSAGETSFRVRNSLLGKLCSELNCLETRPARTYVAIEGDTSKEMTVTVRPSFADNPLLIGPRYQPQDFKCVWSTNLGFNTSGILVMGVNKGTSTAHGIHAAHPIRRYRLKGCLGYKTDSLFHTGNVTGKSTYTNVRKSGLEGLLRSLETTNQRLSFEACGVDLQTKEAYDLISSGMVRPQNLKVPIIYSAKCLEFNRPQFSIELQCINEDECYLMGVIDNIGRKLHSYATCLSIQCVQHSFFDLDHALLKKHWTLQQVLENMAESRRLVRKYGRLTEHVKRVSN